jgi:CheY-like chemotaxis protein
MKKETGCDALQSARVIECNGHWAVAGKGIGDAHVAVGRGCCPGVQPRPSYPHPPGCKTMKILIAEDDALSRLYLKNLLINWDYEVTECENGAQAWEQCMASDYPLIISDWSMPELDGVELCRRIRALNDQCYFILLSTRVGRSGLGQEFDAGIDAYMSKPLDADELKSHLRMAEFLFSLRSGVKSVQALLPTCAWCRKSRISEDTWLEVNRLAFDASFTYSICPDCSLELKANCKSNGAG